MKVYYVSGEHHNLSLCLWTDLEFRYQLPSFIQSCAFVNKLHWFLM